MAPPFRPTGCDKFVETKRDKMMTSGCCASIVSIDGFTARLQSKQSEKQTGPLTV